MGYAVLVKEFIEEVCINLKCSHLLAYHLQLITLRFLSNIRTFVGRHLFDLRRTFVMSLCIIMLAKHCSLHSGAGSILKVGAQFFLLCPHFFVVPPITGYYRIVTGTVTRTELGQR